MLIWVCGCGVYVCMYVCGRVRVSPLYVWTHLSQDVLCIKYTHTCYVYMCHSVFKILSACMRHTWKHTMPNGSLCGVRDVCRFVCTHV